jgi:hypothetical protein
MLDELLASKPASAEGKAASKLATEAMRRGAIVSSLSFGVCSKKDCVVNGGLLYLQRINLWQPGQKDMFKTKEEQKKKQVREV